MKDDKKKLVETAYSLNIPYSVSRVRDDRSGSRKHLLIFVMLVSAVAFIATITVTALLFYDGNIHTERNHGSEIPVYMVYEVIETPDREVIVKGDPSCSAVGMERIDCYPDSGASSDKCKAKGCCWVPASSSSSNGIPYCFYPTDDTSGYNMSQPQATSFGYTAKLTNKKASHWPDNVMSLQMDMMLETETRAHFKIYDPNNKRYEVPIETAKQTGQASNTEYKVAFQQDPAGLTISRASSGAKLFDTSKSQLTFADQFIEISSTLPTKYIYGLGEHRGQFWLDGSNGKKIAFWARDVPPQENTNLYGTHPFFIAIENDTNAYGVFLLNSNAMDVIIMNNKITYRTIGGILDFWIFTGPSPDDVIRQYTAVIGRPIMPPYWALGFHLCRWGYGGTDGLKRVVDRMRKANFPYDSQWNDIDYMHNHYDWTYDTVNYPYLNKVVDDLHNHSQHYVMIVDVGIPNIKGYKPFDSGVEKKIFVEAADGSGPVIGQVWPGTTAYPDFSNPATYDYWLELASSYRDLVKYDGLWTDMNEPSSFVVGSTKGCPQGNKYDYPPFVPGVLGGSLRDKTICPSSIQHLSNHYNVHSLYGHFTVVESSKVMTTLTKKRPFILSRSTFASTGRHGFHWLGDNNADWNNLYYSIPGILSFNMFGIPLIGADICGFGGSTTVELCTRWTQLGAFYPFMRNHNTKGAPDQDPANPSFPQANRDAMREVTLLRYTLLPTLYSLLYTSHVNGTGVARPLFFQYPNDMNTLTIDRQFLWGDALMISPVLTQGATTVQAYFPKDDWFDYYSGKRLLTVGSTVTLDAPMDKINLHMRGGSIVITQGANVTTAASRKNPFSVVVALPNNTSPFSFMWYWDDGESLMQDNQCIGNLISVKAARTSTGGCISSAFVENKYATTMMIGSVRILGVTVAPKTITINTKPYSQFSYDSGNQVLTISSINIEASKQTFNIEWK